MHREQVDPREAGIHALWKAGDFDGAATQALRLYGPEVFGFLLALHGGDEDDAGDVFSIFSEQLWQGLGRFAWACSMRTWAYTIAHHASCSYRRAAQRWRRRRVPLSACPSVVEVVERIRSETVSYLRTDRKHELTELRETLPEEDQALLILRIDKDLAWLDLARIFLDEDASPDALAREAGRLRKRFQLIKRKLFDLGKQRGLLPERSE